MTDAGHGHRPLRELAPDQRRRLLRLALLRPLLTATLLVVAYFLLPLEDTSENSALVYLLVAVVVVCGVLAWQVWEITRTRYPMAQAVEALAAVVPAYLLTFAAAYVLMSRADSSSFSQTLTHVSGLYFTVVVFSTVGFGDITAQTDTARAVVTVQIVLNLILLGAGLRLLMAAVRHGQQRIAREADRADAPGGSDRER